MNERSHAQAQSARGTRLRHSAAPASGLPVAWKGAAVLCLGTDGLWLLRIHRVTSAIFGLVGVLIGAAISYWTQMRVFQARAEADLRAALRLVHSQLDYAQAILATSEDTEVPWAAVGDTIVVSDIWQKALPALAMYLPSHTWEAVEAAYAELARTEAAAQGLCDMGGKDWDDGHGALIAAARRVISTAKSEVADLSRNDLGRRPRLGPWLKQ
jgi:hypothetical protein